MPETRPQGLTHKAPPPNPNQKVSIPTIEQIMSEGNNRTDAEVIFRHYNERAKAPVNFPPAAPPAQVPPPKGTSFTAKQWMDQGKTKEEAERLVAQHGLEDQTVYYADGFIYSGFNPPEKSPGGADKTDKPAQPGDKPEPKKTKNDIK